MVLLIPPHTLTSHWLREWSAWMTPGKEGEIEMRKHNTHESKNNWNKNFLIARSAIYGEMCTNTLISLLLHPSTWKNHTDDYLWGDFRYHQNSFPSFSFSSCSTSSTWAFHLENAFPHGTYGQRGAEGEVQQVCSFYCPYLGNRRRETSIQSDIQFLNHVAYLFRLQHFQM